MCKSRFSTEVYMENMGESDTNVENNYSIEVACENRILSETGDENQEKVTETAHEKECSSADESYPCHDSYYSSDGGYYLSDEDSKRQTKPCSFPSIAETPSKILNEHSYSLTKHVVHFSNETEKQKEVQEIPEQLDENCLIVETQRSPPALASVSGTPTKIYCQTDEEHCYSLDKRKTQISPERSEIEPVQMVTETIEQSRSLSVEAVKARLKRARQSPEQREKRLMLKRLAAIRQWANRTPEQREKHLMLKRLAARRQWANRTPEQREKHLMLKRLAARRQWTNRTPEQRDKRRASRSIRFKKLLENETPEERAKRHHELALGVERREREKGLMAGKTRREQGLVKETPEQRHKRHFRDNERIKMKRASETLKEQEKRRAYHREEFKKYYYKTRETRIENMRERRANDTPEQAEKRQMACNASKLQLSEKRAKLRVDEVKNSMRKARQLASKRVLNKGQRRRGNALAAQQAMIMLSIDYAVEIRNMLQRRPVVVLERCVFPSSFLSGETSLSVEHYQKHFLDKTTRQRQEIVTTQVRADGRNLRPIRRYKSFKRLEECCSSDGENDELSVAQRRADAVERLRKKRANESSEEREKRLQTNAERKKNRMVFETSDNLEKRLDAETQKFRELIEKYSPVFAEERRNEVSNDETVEEGEKRVSVATEDFEMRIDETLETPEEAVARLAAERLAFREWIEQYSTIKPRLEMDNTREEGENCLNSEAEIMGIKSAMDTSEKMMEKRLADEISAFGELIEKYSDILSSKERRNEIANDAEEGEKHLAAAKAFLININKKLEKPENAESRLAAESSSFKELIEKYSAAKLRKWVATKESPEISDDQQTTEIVSTKRNVDCYEAETLAFRKWRKQNPHAQLQRYAEKYTASINRMARAIAGRKSWREHETQEQGEKRLEGLRLAWKEFAENLSAERRAKNNERHRWRLANESPEKRAKRLEAKRASSMRLKERTLLKKCDLSHEQDGRTEICITHLTENETEGEVGTVRGTENETIGEVGIIRLTENEMEVEVGTTVRRTDNERTSEEGATSVRKLARRTREEVLAAKNRRRRIANETPEQRENRLEANRRYKKARLKPIETPEQTARRRERNKLNARKSRAAKKAAQQQQDKSNQLLLRSNSPDTINEDGELAICLSNLDAINEVETLSKNCSNIVHEDHIYTASNCSNDVNKVDGADTLANFINSFAVTDVEENSNTLSKKDASETLGDVSNANDGVIYALSNNLGETFEEGTVCPNTFYLTNNDGTLGSEIIFVYIDGVAT